MLSTSDCEVEALAMSRDSLTRWLNSFMERVSFLVMEGDGGREDNGSAGSLGLTSEARVDSLFKSPT